MIHSLKYLGIYITKVSNYIPVLNTPSSKLYSTSYFIIHMQPLKTLNEFKLPTDSMLEAVTCTMLACRIHTVYYYNYRRWSYTCQVEMWLVEAILIL